MTADCVDPIYNQVIYDNDTNEERPIPHRRISAHFNGTDIDFHIYLPKTGWAGRFFQLVYPLQNSTAYDEEIAFGADSGGYTIRVAGSLGYRADAAVAKLSRDISREYYNASTNKIYGYVYGGSGGSLVTVGALENTVGVWDGGVAMVQATPASIPNNWCIRAFGGLVLEKKAVQIKDFVRPGSTGNLSSILDATEIAVFEEITALGIPVEAWEDFAGVGQNRTTDIYAAFRQTVTPTLKAADPDYASDFWSKSGYLGTEGSQLGDFFRQRLIDFNTSVKQIKLDVKGAPVQIILDKVANISITGGIEFNFLSQDESSDLGTFTGTLDQNSKTASIYSDNNATILEQLKEGTILNVNNRWFLALHSYHRHQLPVRGGFYAYDYLRSKDGTPRYPQRSFILGPTFSESPSGGATLNGEITTKLFVMDNLKDYDAFPWQADWYKNEVKKALGTKSDGNYRLFYSDNADHFSGPEAKSQPNRIVDYTGLYEQLLRDMSAWVENGTEPPEATRYSVEDGQVSVPYSASERLGIQPVVHLTVLGKKRTSIKVGSTVTFKAHIEVPPKTGSVVSTEWDFDGTGKYVAKDFGEAKSAVNVCVTYKYAKAGTYYPAIRVASERNGDTETAFARALNLDRVRVVVESK